MVVEDLIGMKLKLKITQQNNVSHHVVDDAQLQEKISALAPEVRIITSKSTQTQDANPQRLNIYVSDKGIINKIKYG